MILSHLHLQNFRNYSKSEFNFNKEITFIIGPNTSGKTNFLESIYFISSGKSFKTQNDSEAIRFGKEAARIKGEVRSGRLTHAARATRKPYSRLKVQPRSLSENRHPTERNLEDKSQSIFSSLAGDQAPAIDSLEVVLMPTLKKYLVNGVSKRRVDFAGRLLTVLFSPADLDLIIGSPSLRRNFLDSVLEQVDREYRLAAISYFKALRQRNALLQKAQETGRREEKQFEYWDEILIGNGQLITQKKEDFIKYANNQEKEILDFKIFYDKSLISKERLLQYKKAEIGAGVTLVGPHRDDFLILMNPSTSSGQGANGNGANANESREIKLFGSRGQQRLAILQLKIIQLSFIQKMSGETPVLLLDDIFSELDQGHINLVLDMIKNQQTIITTTHKEFVPERLLKKAQIVEL